MTALTFTTLSTAARLVEAMPTADAAAVQTARLRQAELTKPPGSLGRLEELAIFMAGWQLREKPVLDNAQAIVFAGNHGICAQGVNPFPQEVTAQMVANFEHEGAAINQLCRANGASLSVVALDLEVPTDDFTKGPAMNEAECVAAMQAGADAVSQAADIVVLGEMGIGNSTVSAALCAALFGGPASDWVGPGTGSDSEGISLKERVVNEGVALHGDGTPMEILAALGGREQAALCGAVLEARAHGIPVILDGFICTAAVAPLFAADPAHLDHCLVAHMSAEPGHQKLLQVIGKEPILNLGMRLGEGSGAALALGILRSALACHNDMATFAEAGIAAG